MLHCLDVCAGVVCTDDEVCTPMDCYTFQCMAPFRKQLLSHPASVELWRGSVRIDDEVNVLTCTVIAAVSQGSVRIDDEVNVLTCTVIAAVSQQMKQFSIVLTYK